jgi:hypothetical protein
MCSTRPTVRSESRRLVEVGGQTREEQVRPKSYVLAVWSSASSNFQLRWPFAVR